MGTETQQFATVIILFQIEHVKLNNPLMGTETKTSNNSIVHLP